MLKRFINVLIAFRVDDPIYAGQAEVPVLRPGNCCAPCHSQIIYKRNTIKEEIPLKLRKINLLIIIMIKNEDSNHM
jgi:hypothetical protein